MGRRITRNRDAANSVNYLAPMSWSAGVDAVEAR